MKSLLFVFCIFLFSKSCSQTLTSVYFSVNKNDLNKKAMAKLDSLAQLKSNFIFRVFGNADISGNADFNKKLSEKRAETVSQYLKLRISTNITLGNSVGLGNSKQINDNSNAELKSKNRRVDIFIERKFNLGEKISKKELPNFIDIKVENMKVNDTFSLPAVHFIGGRHVWIPKSEQQIAELVRKLKQNPSVQVELQGHICCIYEDFDGRDIDLGTFNLSFTRANAIKEYLEKQGIHPKRIKIKGLGHLDPVMYPEKNDSDRMKNRRVEIMLLKK